MIKSMELEYTYSCMNRAETHEMLFVLLARDPAAPVAIRAWIAERKRLGLHGGDLQQIDEAERCAKTMELQRKFPDSYMPIWAARKRKELEEALERH